ncbi:MAG: M48 family metallopeptidase [Chitinophagaceae bacterium]|nr:M48 family metallopeptidase [Chitinophagaceae bacterium]
MKKLILQIAVLIAVFFAVFTLSKQINWMKLFKVDKLTKSTEDKLGDLIWKSYSATITEETNYVVINAIDSIVNKICTANDIDSSTIKIHIIQKDEVNAFALPGNHLAIYTGLLQDCDNADEVAGVIAHELAHMQKNHVMKKLIKEIGMGAIISLTSGNSGTVSEILHLLTSSAYDRKLETEADITGVDYLMNAEINPEGLAQFLFRMATTEKDMPKAIYWISTHPESEERAKDIMARIRVSKKKNFTKSADQDWAIVKKELDKE